MFVHDAGGAEVIGAYIKKNPKGEHFIAYGAGPAKKIFRRLGLPLHTVGESFAELSKIMVRHPDAAYVLIAAPGWMTTTEINAIEAAKRAGIRTICYMDSWVDERKRFGYPKKNWQRRLPDVFWAGDRYAFDRLQKQFQQTPVRLVPNQYFKNEVQRFRYLKKGKKPDSVLFVSTIGGESTELLRSILTMMAKGTEKNRLRIRFHPADDRTRYDHLIREYSRVQVEKSKEIDLVRDFVHARVVIGAETMALVIAFLCRIPAIRYVRSGIRPMLPFSDIKLARTPEKATRLI